MSRGKSMQPWNSKKKTSTNSCKSMISKSKLISSPLLSPRKSNRSKPGFLPRKQLRQQPWVYQAILLWRSNWMIKLFDLRIVIEHSNNKYKAEIELLLNGRINSKHNLGPHQILNKGLMKKFENLETQTLNSRGRSETTGKINKN